MATPYDKMVQIETDLSQFKAESRKSYGELSHRLKIAEVASDTLIKQVASLDAFVRHRFDKIEMCQEAQEAHLMYLHEKADQTDKRLNRMETRLDDHTARLDRMEMMLAQVLERLPEKH